MFLAGRVPALEICRCELPQLLRALERAGYREHHGPRIRRPLELVAYVRPLEREPRQVHVQISSSRSDALQAFAHRDALQVFAHTEPWGWGLRHLWAALTDGVSYQHGARILREDLAAVGFAAEGKAA